ncbi:MAG: peptidylprolyl isomerase [Prevotella sp.]
MKRLVFFLSLLITLPMMAQQSSVTASTDSCCKVLLQTSKGDILLKLYNETPRHRDNFLKLVKAGYYDGNLFHRVIADFMIQTGDSTTRHAQPGDRLGEYSPDYSIPAEFVYPKYFHKRGALAAAREPDNVNPERASSSAQFYIVWGQPHSEQYLDNCQQRLDKATNGTVKLTPEVREVYKTLGGTPHLDGQYTVFGEVISGLDVVKAIDFVQTDSNDRPLEDVKIIKATIVK